MSEPILCPDCGMPMRLFGRQWGCYHGTNTHNGVYWGPDDDRDGDKIRARIATMEQRWAETHLVYADFINHDEPASIPCALPETCGECAWAGEMRLRDEGTSSAHYAHKCDNAACKRIEVTKNEHACPAGVLKGGGK